YYFAEVIFGRPFILLVPAESPAFVGPAEPIQDLDSPLDNSDMVGVVAGYSGAFQCNGVEFQVINSLPISVVLNTYTSNTYASNPQGPTNVTVTNGVATLNGLGVVFSTANAANSGSTFALAGNGGPNAQIDYDPQFSCIGTWVFKTTWAVFYDGAPYSLQNPPLPLPVFPPGGEFTK